MKYIIFILIFFYPLNIFFDKNNYEIKGWTTTDIYLNKVETKLSNIETNIMIDDRIFRVQNYIN